MSWQHRLIRQFFLLLVGTSLGMGMGMAQSAIALDREVLLSVKELPLDVQMLRAGTIPANGDIVTSETIDQSDLTTPSLWWADEQFGGKLLETWVAYTGNGDTVRRIDLVVNQQIWSIYNYLERYQFLHQMGSVARSFGYSLRVFNPRQELLAAYLCNFPSGPNELTQDGLTEASVLVASASDQVIVGQTSREQAQASCDIHLDFAGAAGLRGRSNPFGGALSTTGRID